MSKSLLPECGGTAAKLHEAALDIILPIDSTKTRTVLDAACGSGELCIKLLQRGAMSVTGADSDRHSIAHCRRIASSNGFMANFLEFDIEREKLEEVYDVVLFLSGLQRLRNPVSALEALTGATREELIIGIDDKRSFQEALGSFWRLISNVFWKLPILYLGGLEKKDWDGVNHFLFSDRAIVALLTRHRYSFARVDFVPWEAAGRRLAVAHKRQIGHLVIVAGVPTSGKTTVMNKLMAGELPDIAKQLDFDCKKKWLSTGYGEVCHIQDARVENLLLHFNITKSLVDGDHYGYKGGLLDLIKSAQRISVVSLWCPPAELRRRYLEGRVRTKLSRSKRLRQDRKNRILLSLYDEPENLARLFAKWLSFVELHRAAPVILESTALGKTISLSDWRQEFLQGEDISAGGS
ncbi:MAG: methyltransferase domain-containing protein [Aestuariivirga sp.]|nr:methyltransferase domain-containing protein [Aestuariivirga sp.]